MTKVYVMASCPDCFEVKARLKDNPEYQLIDIGEQVGNLKEFLHLRDNSPAFDVFKSSGSIGIPCFVNDNGEISFGTSGVNNESGVSCSIDRKGC